MIGSGMPANIALGAPASGRIIHDGIIPVRRALLRGVLQHARGAGGKWGAEFRAGAKGHVYYGIALAAGTLRCLAIGRPRPERSEKKYN